MKPKKNPKKSIECKEMPSTIHNMTEIKHYIQALMVTYLRITSRIVAIAQVFATLYRKRFTLDI